MEMKLLKKIKNNSIPFFVSDHAYSQFTKRIRRIEPNLSTNQLVFKFTDLFRKSNKLKKKSKKIQLRNAKYDNVATYYREKDLCFVVVENTIVTTEFYKEKGYLN